MKKNVQAHNWKVPAPPNKDNDRVDVVCSECGAKMTWVYLEGFGADDFEKLYTHNTRLRIIRHGEPKDRYVMPDCNDEKIRRTHKA